MKKPYILALVSLLLCLSLTLCGCGEGVAPEQPGGTTTTTTAADTDTPRALTAQELADLQTFLRDAANYGFLADNLYNSPKDIDPLCVFYDGAGLNKTACADWSADERRDVLGSADWSDQFAVLFKLAKDEAEAFFLQKTGVALGGLTLKAREDFPYALGREAFMFSSEYNAYYVMHGGGAYLYQAEVSDGELRADGLYTVYYSNGAVNATPYAVTLRRTDDGYQFVSNVAANAASGTAPDYTTPGPLALSGDTAAFLNGTWKVEKLLCFGFSYDNKSEYPTGQDVIGNEIVIHTDRFSSAGLVKYPRYQADVANPYYSDRVTYNGEMFRQEYRVALPDVDANDQVTVIHVSTERTKPNLPPVFYTVNNERLILMLDSAYFELTRVGD